LKLTDYLEDEQLSKSKEAFLNECSYLQEYKIYKQRGIKVPKTIHGKTLSEYLIITPTSELEFLAFKQNLLVK
jgi:hypothetical protein